MKSRATVPLRLSTANLSLETLVDSTMRWLPARPLWRDDARSSRVTWSESQDLLEPNRSELQMSREDRQACLIARPSSWVNFASHVKSVSGQLGLSHMIVRAHGNNGGIAALHVGIGNVLRFFSRDSSIIELELDHLRIQCELPPDFWAAKPEICDRRLCAWLQAKRHGSAESSIPMNMQAKGNNLFQLKRCPMVGRGKGAQRWQQPRRRGAGST